LIDLLDKFSTWGSLLPLLSIEKTTPLKVFWKKNRWNDFEFDLYADVAMNSSILATENIIVKNHGNDVLEAKLSLSNKDDSTLTSRMIIQLQNFPSSVMAKFFPETQVELSGLVKGAMALEFSKNDKKISADLKLLDGQISWLTSMIFIEENYF
jgi:hypothetical protein